MLENIQNKQSSAGSSDRAFGLVFAAVFCVVAVQPIWHGNELRGWAGWTAGSILAVAIIAPKYLAPLNWLWTKFGMLLHSIVSPVALGVLFFALFTPMAIIMRLAGKDPLRRRFDRGVTSYWIQRAVPDSGSDSMNNQF